ncbi:MAG TPA: tripartite tricarboxylate transporter substrate-binding protein, partial [Paracoccaceae bacterium]|nr:tripartite tricarboxylate transporter substrate-binding protein [Paracoccaceae bacterium]
MHDPTTVDAAHAQDRESGLADIFAEYAGEPGGSLVGSGDDFGLEQNPSAPFGSTGAQRAQSTSFLAVKRLRRRHVCITVCIQRTRIEHDRKEHAMQIGKVFRVALAGLAVLATGSLGAAAADEYPSKSIKHIMPWSAGGGTDTAMRTFLEYAKEPLGVDINTQNITGAQSGVGVLRLMNARPDGHTIGSLTWDSMITVPYFGLVPGYDTDKLSYLANVTLYPTVLAVNADTGWETLDDFIAAAKENPGEVTISNSGNAGIWHLHALDMADKLGIELNHVPF